jgi:putative PEP-CTERM system histidine kinase
VADSLLNAGLWAAISALAHALLGAYVLLAGGGSVVRSHMILVAAAGIAWGVVFAQPGQQLGLHGLAWPGLLAEIGSLLAWYLLVARLLQGPYRKSMPEVLQRLLLLFWLISLPVALVAIWAARSVDVPWPAAIAGLFVLVMALVCFALAAQLARDAPIESRTALRAVVAAAGVASGSHVLLLGTTTLAGSVIPSALALAAIAQTTAALFAFFSVRLRPQWSLAIFVSPDARRYAPRLLATGLVTLLIASAIPAMRTLEIASARQLAVLLMLVAGLPLTALMFSERLNARLRVMVNKHFLPFRFDYREEWLRLIDTLVAGEEDSPLPERAIRALAQIVGSPAGVLFMRQSEAGPFIAVTGWNTRFSADEPVPAGDAALSFMRDRQWIIDTAELQRRPELYEGLQRPAWLARFPDGLLLVPLISGDNLIGFVVLLQASSAFRLTFEEIDLLRTSGRQVAVFLAQYEADQKLTEVRQFEAFNRLTAFVMHDLKNLIAQQSLVVGNAARHKDNPAFFEDAIATVENSVARMNKLLLQLQSGESAGVRQRIRLGAAVGDAIERCSGRQPLPTLTDDCGDLHVWVDRDRFTAIIAHLVRNAQEATSTEGHVSVRLAAAEAAAVVTIEDDGCGMDADFIRSRLFRPFDTTKGSKGMGIGAYQARMFVAESGGVLRIESEPGAGTRVVIELPLDVAEVRATPPGPSQ